LLGVQKVVLNSWTAEKKKAKENCMTKMFLARYFHFTVKITFLKIYSLIFIKEKYFKNL